MNPDVITVQSTRPQPGDRPDTPPRVLMSWGPWQRFLTVQDSNKIALDLFACAAYADAMLVLAKSSALSPAKVSAMFTEILAASGKKVPGLEGVLTIIPAASTKHNEPVLLLDGPGGKADITAQGARVMGVAWVGAGLQSIMDTRLGQTLTGLGVGENVIAKTLNAMLVASREDVEFALTETQSDIAKIRRVFGTA